MGDRYVVSNDNKKILLVDATSLYGHSVSQMLPYDKYELWHRHPDHYKNKVEKIVSTPYDSGIS